MIEMIFASGNSHKVEEIAEKWNGKITLLGLKDLGYTDDLPETADTLEGNALQKARFVWDRFGKNCFADDTGLEVHALNGKPGVHSARYAGEEKNSEDNIRKLLAEMQTAVDRRAQFRTVICCMMDGQEFFFEGSVQGWINRVRRGERGFGYDSVFIPEGSSRTFAEMNRVEKNRMSHRGIAMEKFQAFLLSRQ